MVVIFKEHDLPGKKIPSIRAKATSLSAKSMELKNREEKLLKACVPTRTRDQTIILIFFAKFLYIVLKASKKNDVTSGSNSMLCFLSHTMNVFSRIEHPLLLP